MKSNRKFIETNSKKKAFNTTEDFKPNEFDERQGPVPTTKVVSGENKPNIMKTPLRGQQPSNSFEKLPEELSGTFEKIVHQLDLITRYDSYLSKDNEDFRAKNRNYRKADDRGCS